jgi:hypothetical protein
MSEQIRVKIFLLYCDINWARFIDAIQSLKLQKSLLLKNAKYKKYNNNLHFFSKEY